ncbi:MAG: Gfo/Idh/MocA family oxidoreductase, partial [Verrucomicrobia bacterium]|nr:Gfo/Idh/MocA family oxidoreductase [Verrucomicrobiota bacterium]
MNTTSKLTRRLFLRHAISACGILSAPCIIPSSVWGAEGSVAPSQRITIGLIGRGLMGSGHLTRLAGDRTVQVLAVCDVDRSRREEGKRLLEQFYAAEGAPTPARGGAVYNDYRELLARPDIDAVLIATPDHWHALQSIDAAKAGKDVYCEKPVSLTIKEGRQLAETVRRYGRVFQTGTQYRSIPTIRQVCEFVRGGGLGKVKSVFTIWSNLASFIGAERFKPYAEAIHPSKSGSSYVALDFPLPAEPVPEGLDWDLWVGPAPFHPYNRLYHIN